MRVPLSLSLKVIHQYFQFYLMKTFSPLKHETITLENSVQVFQSLRHLKSYGR